MSQHTNAGRRKSEPWSSQGGGRVGVVTPRRRGDVKKLAAVANIGLVGVPAAYVLSQSVAITLAAAALAIVALIAYIVTQRRH